MARTDYKSIDEYHKTFPDEIQERMQSIREMVHEVAPAAEGVISYQIPAFKIGKKYLIYYSAFTNHISLAYPWSETFLKTFEVDLEGMKVSKSVIQFPNNKPLPLDLIKRIVKFRKEEVAH